MKICGCEDAEKGYVIINPDSPDRREILSLNPPICREIIGNSLDIDGEIYIFEKEIEGWTTTPLPSGIKVEWNPSDIQIISGTNWNILTNSNGGWFIGTKRTDCASTTATIWHRFTGSTRILGAVNDPFLADSWDKNSNNLYEQGRVFNDTTIQTCPTSPNRRGQYAQYKLNGDFFGSSNTVRPYSTYRSTGIVYQQLQFLFINPVPKKTVLSNSGSYSQRETIIDPSVSLLAGNFGLVVNYVDATQSPLIEFSQSPQNIKKIETLEISDTGGILEQIAPAPSGEIVISCGERECPPETCFNCDCSELNCCYDENGKLIDSFIRRT